VVIEHDRGAAGRVNRHWPTCWPAHTPAATNGDSWTRCGSNLSLGIMCQAVSALYAIARPLCVRPGTRAMSRNIFIPGGGRQARWWSVPKI